MPAPNLHVIQGDPTREALRSAIARCADAQRAIDHVGQAQRRLLDREIASSRRTANARAAITQAERDDPRPR
jgi:hypothetical protein